VLGTPEKRAGKRTPCLEVRLLGIIKPDEFPPENCYHLIGVCLNTKKGGGYREEKEK
jgi:hypothetical protein